MLSLNEEAIKLGWLWCLGSLHKQSKTQAGLSALECEQEEPEDNESQTSN